MLGPIRAVGTNVTFAAAGAVQLSVAGPADAGDPTGTQLVAAGCLLLTNNDTVTVFFAFQQATGTPTTGIPVPAGRQLVIANQPSATWWGSSGKLIVTPCEVLRA